MGVKRLICRCQTYKRLSQERLSTLPASETVLETDDLCLLCALEPETVRSLSFDCVSGCEPRALKSLLVFADARTEGISFENLRVGDTLENPPKSESDWVGWYPVIDRERCTNCRKCADFCLFGVYSVIGGTVQVTAPGQCKTNCPACARICPNGAVIFPKYGSAPVNGGEKSPSEPRPETDLSDRLRSRRPMRNPDKLFKGD